MPPCHRQSQLTLLTCSCPDIHHNFCPKDATGRRILLPNHLPSGPGLRFTSAAASCTMPAHRGPLGVDAFLILLHVSTCESSPSLDFTCSQITSTSAFARATTGPDLDMCQHRWLAIASCVTPRVTANSELLRQQRRTSSQCHWLLGKDVETPSVCTAPSTQNARRCSYSAWWVLILHVGLSQHIHARSRPTPWEAVTIAAHQNSFSARGLAT